MNDEQQPPPSQPTGRLTFTEDDTPLHRAVISAFMQSYNQYHQITRGTGLDFTLADLIMRARALRQIGEVDETYVEQFENDIRALNEALTNVGRRAACTLDFMAKKRGGEGQNLEEWPDAISDEEM